MKRLISILGTLLIAIVIIISGSAVAWIYAISQTNADCTDPDEALGAPDDDYASLGQDGPPPILGWILLDLGFGNEMPNSQDFTVFAGSTVNETYEIYVGETTDLQYMQYLGTGWDTEDLTFQTPSTGRNVWRYIYLEGATGAISGDPAYGPEIDAVGWD